MGHLQPQVILSQRPELIITQKYVNRILKQVIVHMVIVAYTYMIEQIINRVINRTKSMSKNRNVEHVNWQVEMRTAMMKYQMKLNQIKIVIWTLKASRYPAKSVMKNLIVLFKLHVIITFVKNVQFQNSKQLQTASFATNLPTVYLTKLKL